MGNPVARASSFADTCDTSTRRRRNGKTSPSFGRSGNWANGNRLRRTGRDGLGARYRVSPQRHSFARACGSPAPPPPPAVPSAISRFRRAHDLPRRPFTVFRRTRPSQIRQTWPYTARPLVPPRRPPGSTFRRIMCARFLPRGARHARRGDRAIFFYFISFFCSAKFFRSSVFPRRSDFRLLFMRKNFVK